MKKEIYAPIYDLQSNIACLIDPQKRKIVESYRYSVFGEEEIINDRGRVIADSALGNPWRYQGKRVDKETGFIYFGQRYYDPKTGRWISPDPAGDIDGPNLYTFVHNNPVTYVDYFGLASEVNANQGKKFLGYFYGEYEPYCHCEQHRTCKRGGDIGRALSGIGHGIVDFAVGSAHDLQTMMVYMGLGEMEITLKERVLMIDAVERSQANQMAMVEGWMMDMLSIDESDAVYQSFRSKMTLGLEVGSLVAGGYGVVRGIIAFNKLAKIPVQIAKLGAIGARSVKDVLKVGKFTYSNTATKHFTEFVRRGPNAGKLSRPYMKSQLTIDEIMASGKPVPDPSGVSRALRWDIPGTFRGNEGIWELFIHPEKEMIYHFNFK